MSLEPPGTNPEWETPQGRGGSSGWELRVPGVAVLEWRGLGHGGGCSAGNQGCSGCPWRGIEVSGVGMEGAQGEHGGCSEQEQRVLGMSEGLSG